MSIDDLAKYVFLKHDRSSKIDLNIQGSLETTKDLFCFCMDLLCKGLVLMFGENNRVNVESLSIEQFSAVNERLKLMGIECMLELIPIDEPLSIHEILERVQKIYDFPNNLQLAEYVFEIASEKHIYKIKFNVFHNV
jgi:hypothetical protein